MISWWSGACAPYRRRGLHARRDASAPPLLAAPVPADTSPLSAARPGVLALTAALAGNRALLASHLAPLTTEDVARLGRAAAEVSAFAAAVLRTRREMTGRAVPPGYTRCLACLLGDCGACADSECGCTRHGRWKTGELRAVPAGG